MYAYVENGQVAELVDDLPLVWRNVSGLNLLSPAELKALGWLPVNCQAYDEAMFDVVSQTIAVCESEVTITYTLTPKVAVTRERAREFRFNTHNFGDTSTWDSRTTGEYCRVAALAIDPQAYYDDVQYKWFDSQGNVLFYLEGVNATLLIDAQGRPWTQYDLDGRTTPRLWRDAHDQAVVAFNSVKDEAGGEIGTWTWAGPAYPGLNPGDNITSSRWKVDPYVGEPMEILTATIYVESTAKIQDGGSFHYLIMAGPYKVADFVYHSVSQIIRNANRTMPTILSKDGDPLGVYEYDYSKAPWVLDPAKNMMLIIETDGHKPILDSCEVYGRFYGLLHGMRQQ